MIEQDSISTSVTEQATATQAAPVHHHSGWHSPAEIIGWLPSTATPWQQDSILRANYKYVEKDWQHVYNPLRTPTTKADPKIEGSLNKPMYHSRSLVQPDSIYRPEYAVYRNGVAGDPIPYTISGDSIITSILLFCFIIATIAIANSGRFLQRQFKGLFRTQRQGTTVVTETSSELRFQFFLVAQTCLLFGIITFFLSRSILGETSSIEHYQILGILTGIFALYFVTKVLLYTMIDWVFFDSKRNEQWLKSALFMMSSEGILLFPDVLLLTYFHLTIHTAVVYAIIVVIFTKILSFSRTYTIFFKRNAAVVQSFLYFCALELMPLATLCGVLTMMASNIE